MFVVRFRFEERRLNGRKGREKKRKTVLPSRMVNDSKENCVTQETANLVTREEVSCHRATCHTFDSANGPPSFLDGCARSGMDFPRLETRSRARLIIRGHARPGRVGAEGKRTAAVAFGIPSRLKLIRGRHGIHVA